MLEKFRWYFELWNAFLCNPGWTYRDAYNYVSNGGWEDYRLDGYSPWEARDEDMSYWSD